MMSELSAKGFLQSVGFPDDWEEVHLQNYLADWYRRQGYAVRLEVSCKGGRADILADKNGLGMIIEVKRWLDRKEILGAYGQAKLYQEHLTLDSIPLKDGGKPRIAVVMGLLTTRARDIEEAYKQAYRVEASGGLVVFVDQCEDYYPVCYSQNKFGIYIPNFRDTEYSKIHDEKMDNGVFRDTRNNNRTYRRRTRRHHNTVKVSAVLGAIWGCIRWFLVGSFGVGKAVLSLFSAKKKYGHKKFKVNFLFVYILLAVLAVGLDCAQRLIHNFEHNRPTQSK